MQTGGVSGGKSTRGNGNRAGAARNPSRTGRPWARALVTALSVAVGGWMLFDGGRALVVGDYVTPSSGTYAGQLGPWTMLVEAVGLEPRSTVMKSVFVIQGALTWVAAGLFARRHPRGVPAVVAAAVGMLWYLPFGTAAGLVQVALLAGPARRAA